MTSSAAESVPGQRDDDVVSEAPILGEDVRGSQAAAVADGWRAAGVVVEDCDADDLAALSRA